jgi:hypothetical protein
MNPMPFGDIIQNYAGKNLIPEKGVPLFLFVLININQLERREKIQILSYSNKATG